jgi:uncharacterized protein YbjT (DUF2867 family)
MTILVTGATGTVGAHVVRALRERGETPRAFVRDRERAAHMLGDDVELAVGDLGDRGALARALEGADRMFLACGNVPGQVEHECAAIDAARAARLERIVKLSGPGVAPALVFERWHAEIERHLVASGMPWVLLRPSSYMTNLLASAEAVAHTGRLFAPAGDAAITYVDPRDVAEAAAAALVAPGHDGVAHAVSGGEAITYEQIAAALSAATGRRIEYVDVPGDAARQGMVDAGLPPVVADFIVGMFAAQRAGAMARPHGAVQALTGHAPRPFASFAREHAAAFAPAPDYVT